MKNSGELFSDTGLEDWLAQDKWRGSLAVGTTCGCDVSRLGRDICDYLNAKERTTAGGVLMAFDRDDIRRLAGEPSWRRRILAAVTDPEPGALPGCDYECMIRNVASLGGAVLAGQCCLDATRGLDNVFRVMVSSCGQCRTDDPSMRLDPARFSAESLVHVIADSFADWCGDSFSEAETKPRPRKETMAAKTLRVPIGA